MKNCTQCGHQNVDEARFCVRCGASLPEAAEEYAVAAQTPEAQVAPPGAPSTPAAPAPSTTAPTGEVPPQPTPAGYGPLPAGAAYQAATAAPPSSPHAGTAQPPAYGPYPPPGPQPAPGYGRTTATIPTAYRAKGKEKGALFWVGAVITLAAGVMVLFSSFMTWIKGPLGFGSVSGWDLVVNKLMRIENGFFDYGDGYPIFSGLNTIILGALVILLAVLALAARKKWPGGLGVFFSIVALGIAAINISTILRGPGGMNLISPGAGLILLVAGSLIGVLGGGLTLAG